MARSHTTAVGSASITLPMSMIEGTRKNLRYMIGIERI